MPRISASKRFRTVFPILEQKFGRRERYKPRKPVEQALITLLLKKGKERPAELAIRRLEKNFVDLNEARVASPKTLESILGKGYPPGVGQLLIDTLSAIFNSVQAMNLDDIVALEPSRAEPKLRRMGNMPSRVAGEFLLAQMDYGRLPQGAGILRVARRIKMTRNGTADSQLRTMRRLTPKTNVPRVFHAFETLAERVCTLKEFDCRACPICDHCPTGLATLERLAKEEEKARLAREAEELRLRKRRERERKTRAATERLKKTIQVRSKKLNISTAKTRRKRKKSGPARVPKTKMVQASSAEVKPDRAQKGRRRRKKVTRRASRSKAKK